MKKQITNSDPAPSTSSLFDPEKAFLDLAIVRNTIALILFLSITSAASIYTKGQYPFDFSSYGFNNAANLFKVPIALLTLSIPLLALLAANHRSEQTKRQMALTATQIARTDRQIAIAQGQNIFSNHFKHLEEFEKRFKKKDKSTPHLISAHKVHGLLFPMSRKGDFSVDKDVLRELEGNANSFLKASSKFNKSNGWEKTALYISRNMEMLIGKYRVGVGITAGTNYNVDGENFTLIGSSVTVS
jgi:hypothetical protein